MILLEAIILLSLRVTYLGGEGHRAAGKQVAVAGVCGEQAELGLVNEGEEVLDLLLQRHLLEVLLRVRVGGLGAGVCVAEGRHDGGVEVCVDVCGLFGDYHGIVRCDSWQYWTGSSYN